MLQQRTVSILFDGEVLWTWALTVETFCIWQSLCVHKLELKRERSCRRTGNLFCDRCKPAVGRNEPPSAFHGRADQKATLAVRIDRLPASRTGKFQSGVW